MPEPLSAERLGKLLDEATEELRMRRAEIDRLRAEVEALRGPSVEELAKVLDDECPWDVASDDDTEGDARLWAGYARTILRALGRYAG